MTLVLRYFFPNPSSRVRTPTLKIINLRRPSSSLIFLFFFSSIIIQFLKKKNTHFAGNLIQRAIISIVWIIFTSNLIIIELLIYFVREISSLYIYAYCSSISSSSHIGTTPSSYSTQCNVIP